MSTESTQYLINSARKYTNLEDYKNAMQEAMTALNQPAPSAGVESVEGDVVDNTDPANPVISSDVATEVNITLAALRALSAYVLKTTYRITDSSQGVIRVFVKSTTLLTATAMKEGTDDGSGSITAGEWGNYDLDADVFTPTIAYKEWVGLLNSTNGTDMTITELNNNLGEAITVTFDSGLFTITKATDFNLSKTAINIGTSSNSWAQFQAKAVSGCDFSFVDISGSAQLALEYVPISVRIYP
jgi:hypothetical protein